MSREFELMMYGRLFAQDSWLSVTLLLGLFGILLFRRDAIARPGLFKMAWFWFAASVALPSLASSVILQVGNLGRTMGREGDVFVVFQILGQSAGPLCMAIAIYCMVQSVLPSQRARLEPSDPIPHPLD